MLRVLAIDPTGRGFAYAVLEGSLLIDWGRVEFKARDPRAVARRLEKLFERYEPDVLVIEELATSRRRTRARRLITTAASIATNAGLEVRSISMAQVRETYQARTKHELAVAVSKQLPELERLLPKKRRPWEAEDTRTSIFMATAFAATLLSGLESASLD